MTIVLIVSIMTSYGAVNTLHQGEFKSYEECAADAVGRIESMRPLYPNAELRWQCEAR